MNDNLEKCCHAIDMQKKYADLVIKYGEPKFASLEYDRVNLYSELAYKWAEKAKEDCKGVLREENYNFASDGSIPGNLIKAYINKKIK